ncbi:class I SAM-dependent methyltransferase [candidate division CSSED10-310 bacterium]|uniref:Class I SAM-dependent methyltransferase n=1 Tax=candidate division CSSED10-310 bacterium TaxID=2855610 RepID=A0ABV6YS26_UNCC1
MTSNQTQSYYFDGRHYDSRIELTDDIPFWLEQARAYGDPVLELACGTGRISIPLAREGFQVTGLDLSDNMLAEARRKSELENLPLEWIQGDGRDFDLGKQFNLIFIPFNSLSEFHSRQDLESCFACVWQHLLPQGRFIVDVFNPRLDILLREPDKRYPHTCYPDPQGRGSIEVTESNKYDDATQINEITLHNTFLDHPDRLEFKDKLVMRIFYPQEIDALLTYNGFRIEHKLGDYDGHLFRTKSPKQLIVCEKTPRQLQSAI